MKGRVFFRIAAVLILLVCFPNVRAADPGHSAAAISSGSFESGNYLFPSSLNVTDSFYVGGGFGDGDGGLTIQSNGNIFTDGSLTFSGDMYTTHAQDVNGSIFPMFNEILSLGNESNQWLNIWGKNIYEGGSLLSNKYLLKTGDTATGNYTFDSGTFFIDSTQDRVGIGTTDPISILHIISDSGQGSVITIDRYDGQAGYRIRRANGNVDSPTALVEDDILGALNAYGYGATGFSVTAVAAINFVVAENFNDTNQGAYMTFRTTPIGSPSTSNAEMMRITDGGYVGIGTTSPTQKLDVNGSINISGNSAKLYSPEICIAGSCQTSWPSANTSIPTGTIIFYNGTSCPTGWVELTSARGRYLIGLNASNGTLEGAVGTALTDQENRAVGLHNHTINDPGHSHNILLGYDANAGINQYRPSGAGTPWGTNIVQPGTTDITVNANGSVAGTNAPYIQYLVCIYVANGGADASTWANSSDNIYNLNSGNVGIGTATPIAKLHIIGDVYANGTAETRFSSVHNNSDNSIAGFQAYGAGGTGGFILASAKGSSKHLTGVGDNDPYLAIRGSAYNFHIGNSQTGSIIMTINASSGSVGIGTTSPSVKLEVIGGINATDWTNATTFVQGIATATNTTMKAYVDARDTAVNTSATAYSDARLSSAISTENTTMKAYVDARDTAVNTSATTYSDARLSSAISTENTTMKAYVDARDTAVNTSATAYSDAKLGSYLLKTGDTATGNYTFDSGTFFIDSTQDRVGIGTTSPSQKLEIAGTDSTYMFLNPADTKTGAILIGEASNQRWQLGREGSTDDFFLYSYGTGSTVMQVDYSTGNIGIGTTSPSVKLEVIGGINATDWTNATTFVQGIATATNTTMKAYVDARDTAVNTSATAYSDARLSSAISTENTTMKAYVDARITNENTTMKAYVDARDTAVNTSATAYSDAKLGSYLLKTGDTATGNYTFDSGTFFIDSTQDRVGIGTTGPNTKLEIAQATGATQLEAFRLTSTDASASDQGNYISWRGPTSYSYDLARITGGRIALTSGGFLKLEAGDSTGTRGIYIENDGNVGIGDDSPDTARLDVTESDATTFTAGNMGSGPEAHGIGIDNPDATANAYGGVRIYVGETNSARGYVGLVDEDGAAGLASRLFLANRDSSTGNILERLVIDEAGNVGIGTTSPGAKLDIFSDTSSEVRMQTWGNTVTGFFGDATFDYSGGTIFRLKTQGTNSNLIFGSENTDVLTIDENQNVGIGITNPSVKLEVIGGINATDWTNATTFVQGIATATNTTMKAYVDARDTAVNTSATTYSDARLSSASIPSGAVMYFNLSSCPSGWSNFTSAEGRYVVGLISGGTLSGTAGTVLSNLENRSTGAHTHTVGRYSRPHAADGSTVWGAGGSDDYYNTEGVAGGATAGTNAPYIQLLACIKN